MSKQFKRTLITTALPYANGPVHIGHLAGVYIPADIYARYLRLKGEEVLMIGGSDEHGVPITIRAQKEGITPQDVVDRYHAIIKDGFERLGITSMHLNFSVSSMIKGNSLKRRLNNTMTSKPINSLPTAILQELVLTATTNEPMVTNAKVVVPA